MSRRRFDFKSYHGATLFKQGTELTAMQRGNLDMATLAIYELVQSGAGEHHSRYRLPVPRLRPHAEGVRSGVLDDLLAEVEAKAKIKNLSNPYIGTREVNLKGDKQVMTPADLARREAAHARRRSNGPPSTTHR